MEDTSAAAQIVEDTSAAAQATGTASARNEKRGANADVGEGTALKRHKGDGDFPPPLPTSTKQRIDDALYMRDGQIVRWSSTKRDCLCTCELEHHGIDSELCPGRRITSRCKSRVVIPSSRGHLPLAGALAPRRTPTCVNAHLPSGAKEIHPGQLAALVSVTVIPACGEKKWSALIVSDPGTWTSALAELPEWSGKISVDGKERKFPLRLNAEWRRLVSGKHALALQQEELYLIFKICLDTNNPTRPVFSVRAFKDGPFSVEFKSTNCNDLERMWLSQSNNLSNESGSFSNIKGKVFVGFNNPGLGEYLCSKTPGFEGFGANQIRRGPGVNGDLGERQLQRVTDQVNKKLCDIFSDVPPSMPGPSTEEDRVLQRFPETFM